MSVIEEPLVFATVGELADFLTNLGERAPGLELEAACYTVADGLRFADAVFEPSL